ncbi:hypothetical protein [Chitinophaga sp. Cy-1792]|uniref:hypothetical protein n=1 Tax=Chitinophaga sp. Cy-1792 TaxID=2608339 RepID=UPI0014237431|nr:hypothetical protein [Chitinophaga sp. Cy-1792]NIG55069.1 hypothetical protein [Chitinophaga sp. Cy-1792]
MASKKEKKLPAYQREQGKRGPQGPKKPKLNFSLELLIDVTEGQRLKDWEALGHLANMMEMIRHLNKYTCEEALQDGSIKQYGAFPKHSGFTEPKHLPHKNWGAMHITKKSKEVVAGFFEENIFYIIFLDKEHAFYPVAEK